MSYGGVYKTATVRRVTWNCSKNSSPTVKLVIEKEEREDSNSKVIDFDLRERNSRERESIVYL